MEYSWPGNVRELRNAIEHAFVTLEGKALKAADLPREIREGSGGAGPLPEVLERRRILEALEGTAGNRSKAARALGVSRVTLWKRMQKLGLVKSKP